MTTALRWIAVPLSGLVAWYATLLLAIGASGVLDALCPRELVVSGACTATWYEPAFYALTVAFSALAAILIVFVPALVAPSHRFGVAILAFACGAAFATYFAALERSLWGPFVAASVGGSAALWLASTRWRQRWTAA